MSQATTLLYYDGRILTSPERPTAGAAGQDYVEILLEPPPFTLSYLK